MKYKVPFVNFPLAYKKIKPEIDAAIFRCLENGDLILRDDVRKFEENLARFVGTKYAVGLNSGTDALFLSLKAAGIGPGDEVITVSHTFVATIEAIVHCGAKPVLVDVYPDMTMAVGELEKALTAKTKAIIPVHFAGRMAAMKNIMRIAEEHDLFVIEDAAQALGASMNGKKAGSWGTTGCFSFYPAKVLGCYGDGGAITTNIERIADRVRLLRDHCQQREGTEKINEPRVGYGYNSRLDNIQAAVLRVKMNYLPSYIEQRRRFAKMYARGLEGISSIELPFYDSPEQIDTFQNYIIQVLERDKLAQYLKDSGVEVLVRDTVPNHLNEKLNLYSQYYPVLPKTEELAKTSLQLPIVPELTDEQIKYVIATIKSFYSA